MCTFQAPAVSNWLVKLVEKGVTKVNLLSQCAII